MRPRQIDVVHGEPDPTRVRRHHVAIRRSKRAVRPRDGSAGRPARQRVAQRLHRQVIPWKRSTPVIARSPSPATAHAPNSRPCSMRRAATCSVPGAGTRRQQLDSLTCCSHAGARRRSGRHSSREYRTFSGSMRLAPFVPPRSPLTSGVPRSAAHGDWDTAAPRTWHRGRGRLGYARGVRRPHAGDQCHAGRQYTGNQERLAQLETVRVVIGISLVAFVIAAPPLFVASLTHVREQRLIATAQDRSSPPPSTPPTVSSSQPTTILQLTGSHRRPRRRPPSPGAARSEDHREHRLRRVLGGSSQGRDTGAGHSRASPAGARIWTNASLLSDSGASGRHHEGGRARDLTAEVQLDTSRQALAAIVDASNDAIVGKSLKASSPVELGRRTAVRLYGHRDRRRGDDRLLPPDGVSERATVTARLLRGESGSTHETQVPQGRYVHRRLDQHVRGARRLRPHRRHW